MDDYEVKLTKLENELGKSLPQLRQSEDIVEGMVELINQLDPKAYNSIKQQRLVDNLKKVANSSNKHQTLQQVNVAEQENILSPLDECANSLESLNNEQKSIEEAKILNNTQTTTSICSLEEHSTLHSSDIHNLHVEKTQINQQSSENVENFKELNDQINSSQEQKRFEELVNIAEKMQKKISLLEHSIRLDRIEKNVESLNKLMTQAEVNSKNLNEQQNRDRAQIEITLEDLQKLKAQNEDNFKNLHEQQDQRRNQLVNIGERLVRIESNVEFKETNLMAPAKEHPKTLLQQKRKRWNFMDNY